MSEPVTIQLVDREFLVACEPEERDGLLEASAFLDAHMRTLRKASKSPGFDRLAVLTAVDITHQLLELRQQGKAREAMLTEQLRHLRQKLEAVLADAPTPL